MCHGSKTSTTYMLKLIQRVLQFKKKSYNKIWELEIGQLIIPCSFPWIWAALLKSLRRFQQITLSNIKLYYC